MYIITGCSSGLGFELVKQLLAEGKEVLGISRSLSKAEAFSSNNNFQHFCIDLSGDFSIKNLLNKIDLSNQEIYLILNAAQFANEEVRCLEVPDAKAMFEVNYFSTIKLINEFKKYKLKRVMFINSIAGIVSQGGQLQYSASKHALQAYSETLAKQSKNLDFDVMSINPGGIDSELWDNVDLLSKTITNNFINPEVLADLLYKFLKLPHKTYIKSFTVLPEHDV